MSEMTTEQLNQLTTVLASITLFLGMIAIWAQVIAAM